MIDLSDCNDVFGEKAGRPFSSFRICLFAVFDIFLAWGMVTFQWRKATLCGMYIRFPKLTETFSSGDAGIASARGKVA